MATWSRSILTAPFRKTAGDTRLVQLEAAINAAGMIELFAADTTGALWNTYQYWQLIENVIGRRKFGFRVLSWQAWEEFGGQGQGFKQGDTGAQLAVVASASGALVVFVAFTGSADTYQNTQDYSNPTQWYGWQPMASLPKPIFASGSALRCLSAQKYGLYLPIVVCYLVNNGSIYYNTIDISKTPPAYLDAPGTPVSNSIVPDLPPGSPAPSTLSMIGGVMGITLLAGAVTPQPTYYGAEFGSLTGWTKLQLAGTYPVKQPALQVPDPAMINYNVGPSPAAAFFVDNANHITTGNNAGGLNMFFQGPGITPPYTSGPWGNFVNVLPATTSCHFSKNSNGPVAVCEDLVADAVNGPPNQVVFLTTNDGYWVQSLACRMVPGTTSYSHGPVLPVDTSGGPGTFAPVDLLKAVTFPNGITVFGMQLGQNQSIIYYWSNYPIPQIL